MIEYKDNNEDMVLLHRNMKRKNEKNEKNVKLH